MTGIPAPRVQQNIDDLLLKYWGFDAFRPGQREVVENIIAGRPVLAVMPTGAGKSLCYQLPALLFEGITIVVSPLIALMKDQVDGLRRRGVAAAYLNSTQDSATQRQVLSDAESGVLKLLYVSPERFRFAGAVAALQRMNVALFAIDEAHCISQWGHDFRPDYKNLGQAAQTLGAQRVAAFTATATRQVREDIVRTLDLQDPVVKVAGFLRDNLHLSVVTIRKMKDKPRLAASIIERAHGATIIYCATRKNCAEAASLLATTGREVVIYHGGLDDDERTYAQERFQASDEIIIVATNAFGMGVDKANVRAVIHWDIPGSVDAYYQEAGRAGRDGEPAICVLLFTYADTRVQEFFIDKGGENLPYDVRNHWAEAERSKLRAIVRYAYDEDCRHGALLRYFGDVPIVCGDGGGIACDNCTGHHGFDGLDLQSTPAKRGSSREPLSLIEPREMTDAEAVVVQKALSGVARSNGRLSNRQLAKVLRGSKARETSGDPLVASRSYGILKGMKEVAVVGILEAMARAECTTGPYPRLTERGREAMWGRLTMMVDIPRFDRGQAGGKKSSRGRAKTTPGLADLEDDARALFELLKAKRREVAQERGVPAFVVASNKLLIALLGLAGQGDRADWLAVHGVGPQSVDPLREYFGEIIASGSR